MERRVEVRRHTEAGEVSRWIPLAKNSLRPYLPSKEHTLTGNSRSSVDIDQVGSFGDKEADGSFLAELHGYYNPTAERSPRRRTFDTLDSGSREARESIPSGKVKWLPIMSRNSVTGVSTASGNYRSDSYIPLEEESLYRSSLGGARQPTTGRSMSADVSYFRRDSASRWNERCVNFGEQSRGLISYRWMPETGISMSRYIPSPLVHRRTSEGDRAKPVQGARWITYAKNPSPSPIQRKLSERRSSGSEQPGDAATETAAKVEESASLLEQTDSKLREVSGWQPVRKFAPVTTATATTTTTTTTATTMATTTTSDAGQRKSSAQGDQDPSVPDDNRVKQRLRELYDFKTETEWPKRVRDPSRETLWISKSSSEEDKSLHPSLSQQLSNPTPRLQEKQKPTKPPVERIRRNSQDLEFNDRSAVAGGGAAAQSSATTTGTTTIKRHSSQRPLLQRQPSISRRQLPEIPKTIRRESSGSGDQVFEPTGLRKEERRPRGYHQEQLRYSQEQSRTEEEKTSGEASFAKVRERRFFSDDYENPNRRKFSDGSGGATRENKRYSDSSVGSSSRPSYAESESVSSAGATKSSRTASDASYASISSSAYDAPKRGSVELARATGRRLEVSHRRTMSQYEPRPRTMMSLMEASRPTRTASHYEHRPRTPVPPPEIEDLYKDFRAPGKSGVAPGFPSRQRRNSTRYKVYLT